MGWEIVCRAVPFSPTSKTCNLCLAEKWSIVFKSEKAHIEQKPGHFQPLQAQRKAIANKKVRRLRTNGTR